MCTDSPEEAEHAVQKPTDVEEDIRARLRASRGTDAALDGFLKLARMNWDEDD